MGGMEEGMERDGRNGGGGADGDLVESPGDGVFLQQLFTGLQLEQDVARERHNGFRHNVTTLVRLAGGPSNNRATTTIVQQHLF